MTTADRVSARGRSLYGTGSTPPTVRHPSPDDQRGRVANLSVPDTDTQQTAYSTYTPEGAVCCKCGAPFKPWKMALRVDDGDDPLYLHRVCPKGAQ